MRHPHPIGSGAARAAFLAALAATAAVAPAAALRAQQPQGLQGRPTTLQVIEPNDRDIEMRTTPVVEVVQKAADSVVSIYIGHTLAAGGTAPQGQGSGVILDDKGFVITNWHVIAAAQSNREYGVSVKLKDGRQRPARVLSSSPEHDLALLQMVLEHDEHVKPVQLGRSSDLMIGEDVVAIGNPQGHANTVTRGVLSAIGRTIRVIAPDGDRREYRDLLQTDAAINQGNSGGALFDITGRLIGINNAMAVGAENIGFAIPVDTVRAVFETELLSSDRFLTASDAPWLGLTLDERGGRLVVADVIPGSPAAVAGISPGDQLLAIGGDPLRSRLDFDRRALTARLGSPLPLRLRRDGRTVDVEPRPTSHALGTVLQSTGMLLDEVPLNVDRSLSEHVTTAFYRNKRAWRVPLYSNVLRVRATTPGGPAAALGLLAGDVVMGVEVPDSWGRRREVPLDTAADFANVVRQLQGNAVRLLVLRDDEDLVGRIELQRL